MSESNSLNGELAKRLANQFIFSAVVAFVTFYRVEIYSVITKQNSWESALNKMSFWNLGYIREIFVVIGIYLSAILLGSIINYLRELLSKTIDSLLNNVQLVTLSESFGLNRLIINLEIKIEELKQNIVKEKSNTNKKIDIFMNKFKFNGQGDVNYFYTDVDPRKSKPLIYSKISNSYPNKNVFAKLETGETIRFFPHFSLDLNEHLCYEIKHKNLSGICLGHEILFRGIELTINENWEVLFFLENSNNWTTDGSNLTKKYFKLIKEKEGFVFLHTRLN